MFTPGEEAELSRIVTTSGPHSLTIVRQRRILSMMKDCQEFDINYFQDEDGIFTATVPAIRGCVASGKTLEEAYRNAVDAIESCLEARRKVEALKLRRVRYGRVNVYRRPVHA